MEKYNIGSESMSLSQLELIGLDENDWEIVDTIPVGEIDKKNEELSKLVEEGNVVMFLLNKELNTYSVLVMKERNPFKVIDGKFDYEGSDYVADGLSNNLKENADSDAIKNKGGNDILLFMPDIKNHGAIEGRRLSLLTPKKSRGKSTVDNSLYI